MRRAKGYKYQNINGVETRKSYMCVGTLQNFFQIIIQYYY